MPRADQTATAEQTIPVSVAMGWGLGSLAMSMVFQAFSVLLLRYLTDYMGIAAATAGFMIGASKIFDAVVDPAIGVLSDRTRSRWGRRRPYILVGGVACAVTFLLMFEIPLTTSLSVRTVLVEAALLAFAGSYGLFNIPYLAMPPEMSSSSNERTTLIGYRVVAVGVGSLLASVVGPLLVTVGGGGVQGHRLMAIGVFLVVLTTSVACFFLTGRARFTRASGDRAPPFARQVAMALENKPFTSLIVVKLAGLIGTSTTFAITPYVFIVLMRSSYAVMGVYFLVYFIALISAQPGWVWLCRRYGKKNVYFGAAPLVILATLSWAFARPGEPMPIILGRGVVLGVLGGSTLLIIQSMLPDTIQYDYLRTGLRREGMYAGVYTTIEKMAFALSASLVGIVLGASGYIASLGVKVVQPKSAVDAVVFLAVFPAICMFVSALLLMRYHLPESQLTPEHTPAAAPALDGV